MNPARVFRQSNNFALLAHDVHRQCVKRHLRTRRPSKHSLSRFINHGGLKLKTTLSAFICLFIAIGFCGQSSAQLRPGIVAVLDVAEVFKKNAAFNTQLNAIRSQAQNLNNQFQEDMKKLQTEAQLAASTYNPGTPERRQKEAELEQKQTRIGTEYRQANEDLLNREANLYMRTYQQLQQIVQQLANEHNIVMVLRFDRSEVNPEVRTEVVKVVNRAVVFQRDLDLTNMVMSAMGPTVEQAAGQQNIK